MNSANRIIINTGAQYIKAIINICLSLYSTRLILDALDIRDFGIYSVVAGVVGILGYLTNALVVTTQRYLSYYNGAKNIEYVKKIFANSLFLHIFISLLFGIILLSLEYILINKFLNIEHTRLNAAGYVYFITVFMLIITLITTPFKALLIANENIVYISVVEICDGFLKLALALTLMNICYDKLIFYSLGMFIILIIDFSAYTVYCFTKYQESRINIHTNPIDINCIKQITGFAGWTTFGMLAGVCQIQGVAIVINKFFGTTMNAAFGISQQVNGAVRFVSTSIINAMNPQIMKAEGNGDRYEMLNLAGKESKFSSALMILISVPIMIEMNDILAFWLKEVPEYSVMFCRAIMIAFIIDQLTLGLHAANQATGRIETYTILTTIPKILIVPIMWMVLKCGFPIYIAMLFYIGIEFVVAVFRIPYMKISAGLNISKYIKNVILPLIPLCIATSCICLLFVYKFDFKYRFFLSSICSVGFGIIALWFFTLTKTERNYIKYLINSKMK